MFRATLLIFILLFCSSAQAEKIVLDLSPYEYDYARITIFTYYNGVGIKSVNYSSNPPEYIVNQQEYLKYGPHYNAIEVLKDVEKLNVYMDWSTPQRFSGAPPVFVNTFLVQALLVKDGVEKRVVMEHVEPNIYKEVKHE